MKQFWFKTFFGVLIVAGLGGGTLFSAKQVRAYQGASTPSGVYITVTYADQINVRGGPNTVQYPVVGHLLPGAVAPALGVGEELPGKNEERRRFRLENEIRLD